MSSIPVEKPLTRLNHLAMSVTADLLDGDGAADLKRFFGEVFGWEPHPILTVPGKRLVVGANPYEPLLFLDVCDEALRAPGDDHLAFGVEDAGELDGLLARSQAFAATDDRAEITGRGIDDYGAAKIHHVFVRYLLPLPIEVQYLELLEGE